MKELLFVCIGSFFGGGMRYLSGKGIAFFMNTQLPLATLAVNVVGSFLIGLLSAMALSNNISPTFMNENLLLARGGQLAWAIAYTVASISLGIIALIAGYKVGS